MANPRFSDVSPVKDKVRNTPKPSPEKSPAKAASVPAESTANWPGLPGPSQPKNRSGGDKKIKVWPKFEGV